ASISWGSPLVCLAAPGRAATAKTRAGKARKPNTRVLIVSSFPVTEEYRLADRPRTLLKRWVRRASQPPGARPSGPPGGRAGRPGSRAVKQGCLVAALLVSRSPARRGNARWGRSASAKWGRSQPATFHSRCTGYGAAGPAFPRRAEEPENEK